LGPFEHLKLFFLLQSLQNKGFTLFPTWFEFIQLQTIANDCSYTLREQGDLFK